MKLLILVPKITNRLRYIFDLLLNEQLGLQYELTIDSMAFTNYESAKFHYGDHQIGDELFQKAVSLLFEREISTQYLKWTDFENTKIIFPVFNKKSILPFDVFAASFYLVSRYEEYLPFVSDKYGRFEAASTAMYQAGLLQKPLVNIWANILKNALSQLFTGITFKKKSYSFQPTYDIDAAWAYKNKGLFRTLGAYAQNLLKKDWDEIKLRTSVLRNKRQDPFDTFDLQIEMQKKYHIRPIYFILCGDYDINDKNISIRNKNFQNLIKKIGDYADVGIHPSFSSYLDEVRVKYEIQNLSQVLNREITKSRQHFLRMNLPMSYQKLLELDITDDYTMGFASQLGFRAGIADSFYFYDLEHDIITCLRVHPFALMDGTLRDYMKVDAEQGVEQAKQLISEIKAVDGTFVLLWHNETLSNEKRWTGWLDVYEKIVEFSLFK